MNKYYKALELLALRSQCDISKCESLDCENCGYGNERLNAMQTLNNLIIKMETIGLELNNTHFMDNDCKLKTLEIIERIFRE